MIFSYSHRLVQPIYNLFSSQPGPLKILHTLSGRLLFLSTRLDCFNFFIDSARYLCTWRDPFERLFSIWRPSRMVWPDMGFEQGPGPSRSVIRTIFFVSPFLTKLSNWDEKNVYKLKIKFSQANIFYNIGWLDLNY